MAVGVAAIFLVSTCTNWQTAESAEYRTATRVALEWNRLLLHLERHTPGYRPPVSARMFAYVEMAAYEASLPGLSGYMSLENKCPGYRQPGLPGATQYNLPIALNAAYAQIVRLFFPTALPYWQEQITRLESTCVQTDIQHIASDMAQSSVVFGQKAADAVWRYSMLDHAGHDGFLYNYDHDFIPMSGPGHWQSTGDRHLPALLPHWGEVRPFVINTHHIIAKPPIIYDINPGSAFYTEAMEVFSVSQTRTKEDLWIAEFWSDDLPGLTLTPAGRWISITSQALEKAKPGFPTVLETYLKTAWALCDGSIVCWQEKYRYQLLRPETYIHQVIQPSWSSLHDSPSFPTYPSGHAILGGAVAEVLESQLGEHFYLTEETHEGRVEFSSQSRSFHSFADMAQENAFSRVLMGVHFRMDCEEGLRLGKIVGQQIAALSLRRDAVAAH